MAKSNKGSDEGDDGDGSNRIGSGRRLERLGWGWMSVGEEVRRERVKTTEGELRRVFGEVAPTKMAIEVGTHSAWVMRVLSSLGHTVVVANARRVALISKNKRKNNRIDAEFLARLLRSDEKLLFPIRHREASGQADLAVLRSRDVVVACRTKLINHVRGVCKTVGTKLPKCSAEAFVVRCSEHVAESLRTGTQPYPGADLRVDQTDQELRSRDHENDQALPGSGTGQTDRGCGRADGVGLHPDGGRSTAHRAKPQCRRLFRSGAGQ